MERELSNEENGPNGVLGYFSNMKNYPVKGGFFISHSEDPRIPIKQIWY